jgi:hypothetical protein
LLPRRLPGPIVEYHWKYGSGAHRRSIATTRPALYPATNERTSALVESAVQPAACPDGRGGGCDAGDKHE